MPILNWLGKDKVINHHRQTPYRVLKPQYTYGQVDSGNMIIHGDNLDALKALLPCFEGKVKLVVEVKGDDRDNSDSERKLRLGRKWAERAGDYFRYYMVFDKLSWSKEGAYDLSEFVELMKKL